MASSRSSLGPPQPKKDAVQQLAALADALDDIEA